MTNTTNKHEIETAYWVGDIVYMRVNQEQKPGMVTGISIRPNGFCYMVTWRGGGETYHYECELTAEFVPTFE